jgi:hypothetical protein
VKHSAEAKEQHRAASAAVVATRVRRHMAALEPVIRTIMAAGQTSLRQIAKGLNERQVPASRGGMWSTMQVSRVLARMRRRYDQR